MRGHVVLHLADSGKSPICCMFLAQLTFNFVSMFICLSVSLPVPQHVRQTVEFVKNWLTVATSYVRNATQGTLSETSMGSAEVCKI